MRFIVGIDEVGRGPLAGPVGVCALVATHQFLVRYAFVKDSKQLSRTKREEIAHELKVARTAGHIDFAVAYTSHTVIDRVGMTKAIRSAIFSALKKLNLDPEDSLILLDGSLEAPGIFVNQRTIIGGDASEPAIALASIVAKVDRDKRMVQFAKKYPGYGFELHKGYGTQMHQEALRRLGPSPIHRKLFIRNYV